MHDGSVGVLRSQCYIYLFLLPNNFNSIRLSTFKLAFSSVYVYGQWGCDARY